MPTDISPWYIDLEGSANADFSASLTKRLYVLDVEIDIEDEGDVRKGWNGDLANTYDQRMKIFVRSDIFTYDGGSSVQDTGDWRMVQQLLHSRYTRITDTNLDRQLDFFKGTLPGFTAGEIADYGFANIYPINVVRKSVSVKTDDTQKWRQMEITFSRATLEQ